MIKAILMDFNGVIINDERIQMKAYREIFAGEGFEMTDEQYFACTGMNDERFIRHHFERVGKEIDAEKIVELRAKKNEAWRKVIDKDLPLCDGIDGFVKKAAKRFSMGICSMANLQEIEYILAKTGLRDCFQTIVSADDVTECKPNPQAYLEGFRRLDRLRTSEGHQPLVHRQCLVIEDAPQGIEAGIAAGMATLGVTNTFEAEILRSAGASAVTNTLADWMPSSIERVFSSKV
jgi:HAD superfamily hydrolase (TIGR01509 family)